MCPLCDGSRETEGSNPSSALSAAKPSSRELLPVRDPHPTPHSSCWTRLWVLLPETVWCFWPPGKREWQKAFTALKSFVLHPLPKPGAQLYGLKIDQRALVFKMQSQCSSAADSFLSPLSWPLFRWIVPGLFSIPQEMKSNRCASPFSSGSCKRCLGIFVRFWFLLISFCFREDILGHLHICTSQMRIISFARTLTEFHRISFVYHFREWDNISV